MRLLLGGIAVAMTILMGCGGGKEASRQADLVGPIVRSQLPPAFLAGYDTVHIATEFIDLIQKAGTNVETLVFLGAWCSDSRREVPRFLKIVDLAGQSLGPVILLGLDRNKKSPGGEEIPYTIERVPTFIFLKEGKEIGRIVESPRTSIEADMLSILAAGMRQ